MKIEIVIFALRW